MQQQQHLCVAVNLLRRPAKVRQSARGWRRLGPESESVHAHPRELPQLIALERRCGSGCCHCQALGQVPAFLMDCWMEHQTLGRVPDLTRLGLHP